MKMNQALKFNVNNNTETENKNNDNSLNSQELAK